jgi:replicative DNA helicase
MSQAGLQIVDGNLARGVDALAQYVPPYNIEAEQSVLGAMLIQPRCIEDVTEVLQDGDFYRDGHNVLFKAILALRKRNHPVDLVTVQEVLKRHDKLNIVGGMPYLTMLFDAVPSASNAVYYASIVQEKAMLRRLIDAGLTIVGAARAAEIDSCDALLELAHQWLDKAAPKRLAIDCWETLGEASVRFYEKAQHWQDDPASMSGIATPFAKLDRVSGGVGRGEMLIIGGRPSMGKSSLAAAIAQYAATHSNIAVGYVSTETTSEDLSMRILCESAQVDSLDVRKGDATLAEYTRLCEGVQRVHDAPFYIYKDIDLDVKTLVGRAKRLIREKKIGMLVVDHIGHVEGEKMDERRRESLAAAFRQFKQIARGFNVAVVVASQLSRKVESRQDKRPLLSDLYETGAAEADADAVWMVYRDNYYKSAEKQLGPGSVQDVEILIRKARNGGTGTVTLGYVPLYTQFRNITTIYDESLDGQSEY